MDRLNDASQLGMMEYMTYSVLHKNMNCLNTNSQFYDKTL